MDSSTIIRLFWKFQELSIQSNNDSEIKDIIGVIGTYVGPQPKIVDNVLKSLGPYKLFNYLTENHENKLIELIQDHFHFDILVYTCECGEKRTVMEEDDIESEEFACFRCQHFVCYACKEEKIENNIDYHCDCDYRQT